MISASTLRRLSALNLPTEAFQEVLSILAEVQAVDESRRAGQRTRSQRHRNVTVTSPSHEDNVTVTVTPPPAYTSPPKSSEPKRVLRSAKHALPTDFALSESDKQHAFDHGWTPDKLASELARFRDHAAQNDRKCANWHAAWRNWVTSPFQKPNGSHGNGKPHAKTAADVARELVEETRRAESFDFDRMLPESGRG